MAPLLVLLSCAPAPVAPAPAAPDDTLVPLSAPLLLRRMSLDLRGVVPDAADLDAVEADPAALDTYRDAYLADERLERRVVSLFASTWHTRVDFFEAPAQDYGVPEDDTFRYIRSIGEEPLRLLAYVAMQDRPWTDIVTADHTVANEMLADIWNLDYPEGGEGWEVARYRDGRPAAGVLATNGLWWRYVTNRSNLNRSRAAAITKLLLCEDYLARQVSFSQTASLADEDATALAIRTEPACVGCHVSLDPIASSLFGFYTLMQYNPDELEQYHTEREPLGTAEIGMAPGYFGTPITGLAELGQQIAADPRFVRCTAQTVAEALWHREATPEDFDRVDAARRAFLGDGLKLRALLRAVTDTDVYRAGGVAEGASEDFAAREVTWRMLSTDQLTSALEDLTGFVWTYGRYDLLANDTVGYRVLAGGVDGDLVARPQREPGLTWALTTKRLAEAATAFAVELELERGGERRLFERVTLDARPGDADFDAELASLRWRLHAERADATTLAADAALWSAIEAEQGPAEAWKGLTSTLLRDPAFLGY